MANLDFDPLTSEPPEWILGITREIWEFRAISTLERHYADDVPVRSPASVVIGNGGVIPATMATLAEFPDRELYGEDVIWHGDRENGFVSSHRLLCRATHARPGMYGAPTNRALRYRILADCAVRDDQVYDEWLVRDQCAIVRQMGLDERRWTADLIEREGGYAATAQNRPEMLMRDGPVGGKPDDLKRIKGIGKKLEKVLNGLGVYYFRQIAAFSAADMAWVDSKLKFKGRIVRDRWVPQADLFERNRDT